MLNLEERYHVLKWFRRFCSVDLLPVQVDMQTRKVWPGTTTRVGSWTSKAWYALFVVHCLYKILSLLYTLLFVQGVPLHQMIIHGVLASGGASYALWYYFLYVKYVDENAALVRMTLTGIITTGSASTESVESNGKRGFQRLFEYTLQDMIALSLPYMALLVILVIGASFIYDPAMRVLLYSTLPEYCKNSFTFWICFAEEMQCLIMFVGIAIPAFQLQVISFDLVNRSLEVLVDAELEMCIIGSFRKKGGLYKQLRCLQLYVTLINTVHGNIIFTWK